MHRGEEAVHTGGESRLNQGQNPHVNGDTFNTYTYKHTYIRTHVYIKDLLKLIISYS